jgi:hypothetical protein
MVASRVALVVGRMAAMLVAVAGLAVIDRRGLAVSDLPPAPIPIRTDDHVSIGRAVTEE